MRSYVRKRPLPGPCGVISDSCAEEEQEDEIGQASPSPFATPVRHWQAGNYGREVLDTPDSSQSREKRQRRDSTTFDFSGDFFVQDSPSPPTPILADELFCAPQTLQGPLASASSSSPSPAAATSSALQMKVTQLETLLGKNPALGTIKAFEDYLSNLKRDMPEAWSDDERYYRGMGRSNNADSSQSNSNLAKPAQQELYDPSAEAPYKSKRFPWSLEINRLLKDVFKKAKFRPNQENAINATLSNNDVFLIMPTGLGKSLCFQLPALCTTAKGAGVTVVVSPMLSLVANQEAAMSKLGLNCFAINSSGSVDERDTKLAKLHRDRSVMPAIVYVTPELLEASGKINHLLDEWYSKGLLNRFVFDEAHCIYEMGNTFREAYLKVGRLRVKYPDVPIMALTATARDIVQDAVIKTTGMRSPVVVKCSLNRPNLQYEMILKTANYKPDIVALIKARFKDQSGIIYCSTKNDTEMMVATLESAGIEASAYHAGRPQQDRERIQTQWEAGLLKIVCATIAFGLGIDGAAVRFVIHLTLPKSLDTYAQETGRAGRDGKTAHCILYYRTSDANLVEGRILKDAPSIHRDAVRADFRLMDGYCRNTVECRRVVLLRYFGEKFDPTNCNKGCDVCAPKETKKQVKRKDVHDFAVVILNYIRHVRASGNNNGRVTRPQAAKVLAGSTADDIRRKELDKTSFHGAANKFKYNQDVVRQILHQLDTEYQALATAVYQTSNSMHAPVQYLVLGPKADEVLAGHTRVFVELAHTKPADTSMLPKKRDRSGENARRRERRREIYREKAIAEGRLPRFPNRLPNDGNADDSDSGISHDSDAGSDAFYSSSDADDENTQKRHQPLRSSNFIARRNERNAALFKAPHPATFSDAEADVEEEEVVPRRYKNYQPITASATLNVRPYVPLT